jgi:hypothetical protein
MSQLEGFKISDVSPVSESIIDQTDIYLMMKKK